MTDSTDAHPHASVPLVRTVTDVPLIFAESSIAYASFAPNWVRSIANQVLPGFTGSASDTPSSVKNMQSADAHVDWSWLTDLLLWVIAKLGAEKQRHVAITLISLNVIILKFSIRISGTVTDTERVL